MSNYQHIYFANYCIKTKIEGSRRIVNLFDYCNTVNSPYKEVLGDLYKPSSVLQLDGRNLGLLDDFVKYRYSRNRL